jgi:hypothetical protein
MLGFQFGLAFVGFQQVGLEGIDDDLDEGQNLLTAVGRQGAIQTQFSDVIAQGSESSGHGRLFGFGGIDHRDLRFLQAALPLRLRFPERAEDGLAAEGAESEVFASALRPRFRGLPEEASGLASADGAGHGLGFPGMASGCSQRPASVINRWYVRVQSRQGQSGLAPLRQAGATH